MTELVAVQGPLSLFRSGELGVIVDTELLDVYDPEPLTAALARGSWRSVLQDEAEALTEPQHIELVQAAFGVVDDVLVASASSQKQVARTFRVPKSVQATARRALTWRNEDKISGGTAQGLTTARALASGTVSLDTVSSMRRFFEKNVVRADAVRASASPTPAAVGWALWGGDSGKDWVTRLNVEPIVAAVVGDDGDEGDTDAWVDPEAPHEFTVFEDGAAECIYCSRTEDDPLHIGAAAPSDESDDEASVKYFALLAGESEGLTFAVDALFAQDAHGSWWMRDESEWIPAEAPDADALALLDSESFTALRDQVDDPETLTLELSMTEGHLYALAADDIDGDLLDAVFAKVPYVSPEVRSKNASKQIRDKNGKFIKKGASLDLGGGKTGRMKDSNDDGTVEVEFEDGHTESIDGKSVEVADDDAAPTSAARLPEAPRIVEDVRELLEEYRKRINGAGAVTAAGEVEASKVEPLYLAVVDENDTQAVLDLLAVIPAGEGTQLACYRREDGKWVPADDALQDLQGATPPAVAELNAELLQSVLEQMDPKDTSTEPIVAAGYYVLTASGLPKRETREIPQFQTYEDWGALPDEVIAALDEFSVESKKPDSPSAERLKRYWERGEGALKIRWGTNGDWTRCVKQLSKYMGPRAKGYCTLRHKGALGYYPGELDRPGNPKSKKKAFAVDDLPTLEQYIAELAQAPSTEDAVPDQPHVFEETEVAPGCELCGKLMNDPIHVAAGEFALAEDEDGTVIEPNVPHEYQDLGDLAGEAGCNLCGKSASDPIHEVAALSLAEEAGVDPEQPHEFNGPGADSDFFDGECGYCGKGMDDPIHVVTAAGAPAPDTVGGGKKFRIPVVLPEEKFSGDGRKFAKGALSSRDMPLPLMWQIETDDGHKRSVIVGRVDHVEKLEGDLAGLGNAYGVLDTGENAKEAERMIRGGFLRGISADLDEFEADVIAPDDAAAAQNKVTSTKLNITSARLMGVTLVAKPAYAECHIVLEDGEDETVPDGEYYEQTPDAIAASLVAAGAPLLPPKEWFENPRLDKPTHLTVDDNGRVFGHIAAWNVHHIGLPFGTRPPRSPSNYAYFRTGALRTQEGVDVRVGQLTLWGGHAPLQANAQTAVQHYDDTNSAVCDLAAGEDRHGIWVSGALRPGVTAEQVRALRASSPSGDWRPVNGALELVAVCQVNVPGFPIAEAMVASGQVTALVAAGVGPLLLEKQEREMAPTLEALGANLSILNKLVLDQRADDARARLRAVQVERQTALTASADAARARITAAREARDAELSARAAEARARITGITAGLSVRRRPFDESKHPRDHEGKFRRVLGRLEDALGGAVGDAAEDARREMGEAANLEDRGDNDGARLAGTRAADAVDRAADENPDLMDRLRGVAAETREVLARLDEVPGGSDDVAFADLPDEVRALLDTLVQRMQDRLDPTDNVEQQIRAWMNGDGFKSMTDVAALLAQYLRQLAVPSAVKI